MDNKNYNNIPMLDKACKILEVISSSGGEAGISYIAKQTDMSKSTIFRILYTLQEHDFIQKNEINDKYQLGVFFLKAGEQKKSSLDLRKVSLPIMEDLANTAGETVNLGILYDDNVLIVESVSGEDSILVSRLEPIFPLYCSGIGKVLLQTFTDDQLKKYCENTTMVNKTIKTIGDYSQMIQERNLFKEHGYCLDDEEYEYGLYCMAAPIYDCKGNIVAGISVSGPSSRISYKGKTKLKDLVIGAAAEISRRMGYMSLTD